MFNIICYSNKDIFFHGDWPNKLPVVPRVGEYIISDKYRRMKVISITYTYEGTIKIELA